MLIISAGMQKSGSGYLYNLINDLVVAAGHADARAIKENRHLEDVMQQHNNNIGPLHCKKLLRLWWISRLDGDFAVKTPSHPTPCLKILNSMGLVKTIYIYRDPRDVLLSAIDHGKKSLEQSKQDDFIHITEFDTCLRHVKGWVEIWRQYYEIKGVLMIRYEDLLLDNAMESAGRIQKFLGFTVDKAVVEDILWKYSKKNPGGERTGMHFNKALTNRYISEMNEEEKMKCREVFGANLVQMGYLM